jgi:hypothetical protein
MGPSLPDAISIVALWKLSPLPLASWKPGEGSRLLRTCDRPIALGRRRARHRVIRHSRNLDPAAQDADVRERLVALLEERIDGSDELNPDERAEPRGRVRKKPLQ